MDFILKPIRKSFKIRILFFCSLLCWLNFFCQSQSIFKKINQSNGLSNDRVNCIVKEENSFIWVGTTNGLNRYDGNNIKVYSKQNNNLSSNDISDLLIDRSGKIWIATIGGGLNLFLPLEDKFEIYKSIPNDSTTIPSNEINTLFEDSKGNIWLGTKKGMSKLDRDSRTFISYTHQNKNNASISNNDIRSFHEDLNGNLWIGTFGGGLNKFSFKTQTFEYVNSPNFIYSLGSLNKNKILIGSSGDGLLELDVNSLKISKNELILNQNINIIRCIKKDSNGTLWIGTDGDGIFKIENANSKTPLVSIFTKNSQLEYSISSNAIYDFMEDENSNIWIGTAWNGVNVLNLNKEYEILSSNELDKISSPVLSVYKKKDKIFMGLDGEGLSIVDTKNGKIKNYGDEGQKRIEGNYIQHIKETSDATLWLGTFVNGLINFDTKTAAYHQYKHEINNSNSLSHNDVRYVIEDNKSNLRVAHGISMISIKLQ